MFRETPLKLMVCGTFCRVTFSYCCKLGTAVLIGGLLLASRGWAQPLTFAGLQNGEPIDNYYAGGFGGFGSGPGPNYGVVFGPDAVAFNQGSAFFGSTPFIGDTAAILTGTQEVMNVPGGINAAFSFYYAAIEPGEVNLYSGVNDTGTLLASFPLPVTEIFPSQSNAWSAAGVPFSGTAQSVDFAGTANDIALCNVTFGNLVLPEPASLGVLGLAAFGLLPRRPRPQA